ncbi:MAG TPA: hypothetical protein VMB50_06390 [Myxococcales bacterium]|nr:hypothetical protein [Myxococcales bacterium]
MIEEMLLLLPEERLRLNDRILASLEPLRRAIAERAEPTVADQPPVGPDRRRD